MIYPCLPFPIILYLSNGTHCLFQYADDVQSYYQTYHHSGGEYDSKKQLLDIFSEQARNDFSLTDDECRTIFDKSYNYLLRLYSHGEVRRMVADFATALQKRRRMSEHEVAEMLAILNQ